MAFLDDAEHFFQDFWPRHPHISLDSPHGGLQRTPMARESPLQSYRISEIGHHDKPAYFGQSLVEAATDASGEIPPSLNQTKWSNLQSLAFTSRLLHPTIERDSINDLLQAAAGAAMEMPKL
jgi:hypothetical protein